MSAVAEVSQRKVEDTSGQTTFPRLPYSSGQWDKSTACEFQEISGGMLWVPPPQHLFKAEAPAVTLRPAGNRPKMAEHWWRGAWVSDNVGERKKLSHQNHCFLYYEAKPNPNGSIFRGTYLPCFISQQLSWIKTTCILFTHVIIPVQTDGPMLTILWGAEYVPFRAISITATSGQVDWKSGHSSISPCTALDKNPQNKRSNISSISSGKI